MGIDMDRVKFTTSTTSQSDVRWYQRQRKSDYPYVLYVNSRLVSESNNIGDANREYEKYAAL